MCFVVCVFCVVSCCFVGFCEILGFCFVLCSSVCGIFDTRFIDCLRVVFVNFCLLWLWYWYTLFGVCFVVLLFVFGVGFVG